MKTHKVAVILATYNGEKYLLEQMNSLYQQTCRPDCVVLRDDGSSDDSVSLVTHWAKEHDIELIIADGGDRVGPARSFFYALQIAPKMDLYLFCDQDDVWLPNKIELAMSKVPCFANAAPTLYATRLRVVDSELRLLSLSKVPRQLSFESAVCESVLTGCTMAFNHAFRCMLNRHIPRYSQMHDWWCYLLATGGGTMIFDDTPTILYRQHANNALGSGPKGVSLAVRRCRRFLSSREAVRMRQLNELVCAHEDVLNPRALALAKALLSGRHSLWRRMIVSMAAPIRRQAIVDTFATRLAILFNRF